MTSNEWDILLWDIARKAADEKYKLHDDGFKPQEIAGKSKADATREFANAYQKQLADRLKYDELDDEDRRVIKNYPISKMTNWLEGVQEDDPRRKAYEVKFDKFASLLDDNANKELGQPSWKDMDFVNDQAARNKAKELGYNLNKVEDRGEFFKRLAEFQTAYDRGIAADDLGETGVATAAALALPSTLEEAERQIVTGEGDENDIYKMLANDATANLLTFGLPGSKLPYLKNLGAVKRGVADAVLQGFSEIGRQGGKIAIDPELDVNYAAPVAATSLGLTRPGMYLSAQSLLSKLSGPQARSFARGMMKASRSGDPRVEEETELVNSINQMMRNRLNETLSIARNEQPAEISRPLLNKERLGLTAPAKLEALGFEETTDLSKFGIPNDGIPTLSDMLADKEFMSTLSRGERKFLQDYAATSKTADFSDMVEFAQNKLSPEEFSALQQRVLEIVPEGATPTPKQLQAVTTLFNDALMGTNSAENDLILDLENRYVTKKLIDAALKEYKTEFKPVYDPMHRGKPTPESQARMDKLDAQFPQKAIDENLNNTYSKAGRWLGEGLAGFGSKFEPTFKWNPLSLVTRSSNAFEPAARMDYTKSDWYANMDPEKRAAFEKALADLTKSRRK